MKKNNIKVMIGNKNVLSLFFSNSIVISLMLLPFFKTDGFKMIPYLSEISNVLLFFETTVLFCLATISHKSSPLSKMIIIYGIWVYILAPIFFDTTAPSYYYLFQSIGIISLLELGFSYSIKNTMNSLSLTFTIMIVLNFITQTIYNSGLIMAEGGKLFLFGIRTGFPLIIIPGILVNLLNDSINEREKTSILSKISIVIGILSLLLEWVGTGIVQIVIFVILYYFSTINKINLNIKISYIVMLFINYVISILGTTNSIIIYVVNLLGKDITLSGRTIIWKKCIEKISGNYISGYGLNSTINVFGYIKPAHNHWLHILLEAGVIGCFIMLFGFYKSCCKLYLLKSYAISKIIVVFIIVILVGCITEIQLYSPFIYMVFEIPFLLDNLDNLDNTTMPKII